MIEFIGHVVSPFYYGLGVTYFPTYQPNVVDVPMSINHILESKDAPQYALVEKLKTDDLLIACVVHENATATSFSDDWTILQTGGVGVGQSTKYVMAYRKFKPNTSHGQIFSTFTFAWPDSNATVYITAWRGSELPVAITVGFVPKNNYGDFLASSESRIPDAYTRVAFALAAGDDFSLRPSNNVPDGFIQDVTRTIEGLKFQPQSLADKENYGRASLLVWQDARLTNPAAPPFAFVGNEGHESNYGGAPDISPTYNVLNIARAKNFNGVLKVFFKLPPTKLSERTRTLRDMSERLDNATDVPGIGLLQWGGAWGIGTQANDPVAVVADEIYGHLPMQYQTSPGDDPFSVLLLSLVPEILTTQLQFENTPQRLQTDNLPDFWLDWMLERRGWTWRPSWFTNFVKRKILSKLHKWQTNAGAPETLPDMIQTLLMASEDTVGARVDILSNATATGGLRVGAGRVGKFRVFDDQHGYGIRARIISSSLGTTDTRDLLIQILEHILPPEMNFIIEG